MLKAELAEVKRDLHDQAEQIAELKAAVSELRKFHGQASGDKENLL